MDHAQCLESTMSVETTILIRTYNEAKYLKGLLRSIQEQNYTNWEIVIVDSGSTDKTLHIAEQYPATILHIKPENFTFGASLNLGCQSARGQYIAIISGHAYPCNNSWLSNLIEPFRDDKVAMVYGKQRGGATTKLSEERDLLRQFGEWSHILVDEPFGNNANAAIRKSLWEYYPYDENLTGLEDIRWAQTVQRMGYYVYYKADATVYHIHEESAAKVFNRYKREALAYKEIVSSYEYKWPRALKDLAMAIMRDLVYGIQERYWSRLDGIAVFRLMKTLGTFSGVRAYHRMNTISMRHLGYPDKILRVLITGPHRHVLDEGEAPKVSATSVLIKVAYVGVCSTDLEVKEGTLEYYKTNQAQYPVVPGHEFSGIVAEVAPDVHGIKVGDKVVAECVIGCGHCEKCANRLYYECLARREVGVMNMNGAYSTLVEVPAPYVHKVPFSVPLKQAALIEPLAVCLKGLSKIAPERGKRACVVGAGPIGNLCAQVLKLRNLRVTVVDQEPRRLRCLSKFAMNTFSVLTHLESFDYIIEASGNEAVIPQLIQESKPGVKILLLGLPYTKETGIQFSQIVCYDKTIYGSVASRRQDWQEAIRLLKTKSIVLDDFLGQVFPLESYQEAWKIHQEKSCLKVLLTANQDLTRL